MTFPRNLHSLVQAQVQAQVPKMKCKFKAMDLTTIYTQTFHPFNAMQRVFLYHHQKEILHHHQKMSWVAQVQNPEKSWKINVQIYPIPFYAIWTVITNLFIIYAKSTPRHKQTKETRKQKHERKYTKRSIRVIYCNKKTLMRKVRPNCIDGVFTFLRWCFSSHDTIFCTNKV